MATPKKTESGKWHMLVYIGVGTDGKKKYKSVTASSKKECIVKAALMEKNPKAKSKETVKEAVEQYILLRKEVLSPSTVRGYEKTLRCHLESVANVSVFDLDRDRVQKLVNTLAHTLSTKTVKNTVSLLRSSVKGLVIEDIFDIRMPQGTPSEINIPTKANAAKLVEAVKGLEIELPVLLAMQCGLRMSEVLGLKKSDADFEAGTLTIRRAIVIDEVGAAVEKPPKSFKGNRTVPMPPKVAELLKATDGTGYAVNMTANTIKHRLERLLKREGIPPIRFHDLRHYFASVCLMLNMPERYAMEFMGHSTPGMLKKYQHIMDEEKKRLGNQLSNFFN
jgi:integrase